MKYAHYDETTGKLLGWYDDEIHETIPVPNIAVSDTDWQTAIDNGYNYVNSKSGTLSVKDFRTFNEKQQEKINKLKSIYQSEITSDIEYMNTTFQADEKSQDMISKVLIASGGTLPADFYWVDSNNNKVSMTHADLQGLSNAILIRGQKAFDKYQTLKSQVLSATSEDKLNTINW